MSGLALLYLFFASPSLAELTPSHRVLVLHSSYQGYPWTDAMARGIEMGFAEGGLPIEFWVEYLDTKRNRDAAYFDLLHELWRHKYREQRFDLIITGDNDAYDFMLKQRETLFSDTPLVFTGFNGFDPTMLRNLPQVTGVAEDIDIEATIDVALRLHPKTHSVVFVAPEAPAARMAWVKDLPARYAGRVEIVTLTAPSREGLDRELAALGPDIVVIPLNSVRVKPHGYLPFHEFVAHLATDGRFPVYALWDIALGHGIVGGKLVSGELQGRAAAQLALRILRGTPISEISPLAASPNGYLFDWDQLQHFDVDLSALPATSSLINQPESLYTKHKTLIWSVATMLTALSALIVLLSMNIARRVKAEAGLKLSESRFRDFADAAADWFWEMDAALCFTFVSEGHRATTGLDSEDIIGRTRGALRTHHRCDPQVWDRHLEAMREHRPYQIEYGFRRPDGELRYIYNSGKPVFDAEGGFLGYRGIGRNITERKRAEEAVQLSESRFRDFADAAADWFWEMGPDLRFTYLTGRIEEITSVKPEAIVGKTRQEYYGTDHDLDSPLWQQHLQTLQAHQPFTDFQIPWYREDGEELVVSLSGKPRFDEDGHFLGYRGTGQDITVRHRAEQALRRAREADAMFKNLVDNIPGAAYSCLLDEHWTTEYMSQGIEDISGYPPEAFIGEGALSPASFIHPDDVDRVDRSIRAAIGDQRSFVVEYRIRHADGDTRWVWERGRAIESEDDHITHLEGVIADITEQKRTELALRRSQKMDAIGQLTGGIAHDFNNILGIILGNLNLLRRQLPEDEKALRWANNIQQSAQRAVNLTKQLLGFSRRHAAEVAVTDINRLMDDMDSLIAHSLTPSVAVKYQLIENPWLTEVDPGDFQDALLNLIINARDAMPGGGQLTLETANRTLDAAYCAHNPSAKPGNYVQLVVSDSGQGIPADQQEHIFEPFFTTKPQGEGTGLGLAMVYGFVKRSGGHIAVYSETGVGTAFRLYLPRAKGADQPKELRAEPGTALPRGTEMLLVVDDEAGLLELAKTSLTSLGYRVLIAGDGHQALTLLDEVPDIELLFSDVVMPGGMDGYELAHQATTSRPDLKVLLTSGYTQKAATQHTGSLLTTTLLSKPYTQAELAQRVRVLLDTPVDG